MKTSVLFLLILIRNFKYKTRQGVISTKFKQSAIHVKNKNKSSNKETILQLKVKT